MKCSPTVCDDCQSSEADTSCSYCFNSFSSICFPIGMYNEELSHGWWNSKYMSERMYLNSLGFDWQACAEKYTELRAEYEKLREEFYSLIGIDVYYLTYMSRLTSMSRLTQSENRE